MWFKTLITLILLLSAPILINASENSNHLPQGIGLYDTLLSAIEMDSINEIQQFIAFGADINHRYPGGITPLMFASSFGNTRSIQLLIEHGANTELKSDKGMTAFDYAKNNNQTTIFASPQSSALPQVTQSKRQMVTTIQFYLNRLGYIAGDLDGVYGKKTRDSLTQFIKDSKQTFPAEISERQIEALFNKMSSSHVVNNENVDSKIERKTQDSTEIIPTEVTNELAISDTNTVEESR
jgi:hypothetical protein